MRRPGFTDSGKFVATLRSSVSGCRLVTPLELERLVTESRAACGLPPRVEDPSVLDKVFAILNGAPHPPSSEGTR